MLENNPTAKGLISGFLNVLKTLNFISGKEHQTIIEVLSGCSDSEYLRKLRAAQYLGISIGSLESYVKKGKLKAYRLNKSLRFKRADLDELLEPLNGGTEE